MRLFDWWGPQTPWDASEYGVVIATGIPVFIIGLGIGVAIGWWLS